MSRMISLTEEETAHRAIRRHSAGTRLAEIGVDPQRFQFRDEPWAKDTVDAIVADGIDLARFDPIPVICESGRIIVAGDGHSRLEAIRRLATEGRLPAIWRAGRDWEIPTREVEPGDALRLAYVANMSRSPFTACEEAKIFQRRLDAGEPVADIARSSHVSPGYITKRLRLNCLCRTIRDAVGKSWGIDTDKAIVLAEACERFQLEHPVQQQLWHRVIQHGNWTPHSLGLFLKRFGSTIQRGGEESILFNGMPANVEAAVVELSNASRTKREAYRMLVRLMRYRDGLRGVADDLMHLLEARGDQFVEALKDAQEEDAAAMSGLMASQ